MTKRLPLSALFFIVFLVPFFSFASAIASDSNKNTQPFAAPTFSTTAPTANVIYDRTFTYNFSATDGDLDGLSFYVPGAQQSDATYTATHNTSTGQFASIWQSFTAVNTGILVSAGAKMFYSSSSSGGTVTVKIYSGEGTSGTLMYSTTMHMPNAPNYQMINIPVSSNVIITSGQKYTIEYSGSGFSGLYYIVDASTFNPYPNGISFYNGATRANVDLPFQTFIKPLTTTPTASWLSLTDNGDGTGSLTGTPTVANAGAFSETLIAKAGSDYISQSLSFNITAAPVSVAKIFAIANNGAAELKWSKSTSGNFGKYYIYGGTASNPAALIDSTELLTDTIKIISNLTNGTPYFFRIREKTADGYLNEYSPQDAVIPVNGSGNVLTQNGSSNNVTAPYISALSPSNALTVEAWFKLNSLGTVQYVVSKGTDDLTNGQFGVLVLSNNTTQFHFRNGNNHQGVTGFTTVAANKWYHIAGTWDGSTMRLYLNGKLEGSVAYSATLTAYNSPLQIGRLRTSAYMLNGSIDEVRIWNYQRTQSQLRADMVSPLRGDESGIIALYHFDEPTNSTVAYDASPNNNNVTVSVGNFAVSDGSMPNAPLAPSGLTTTVGNGGVLLKWNKNSELTVSKYYIYSDTGSEASILLDSTTSVSDTMRYISNLTNGTKYYFRIKAMSEFFQYSGFSSEKSVIPTDGAGNMLTFNGENQYAEILNDGDFDFENGTAEFWVSPTWSAGGVVYNPCVIALRNSENTTRWSIHITSTLNQIDLWNGSEVYAFDYDFSTGIWYHVAMVKNSSVIEFFINGVSIGQVSGEFGGSQNLPLHIASSTTGTEFFQGSVDEVRLWSVAKSSTELLDNMFVSATGAEENLIGLWQFNESEGSVIYDASPNANDGVLINSPFRAVSVALSESSLPVELSSFSAQSNNGKIVLNWSTLTESNNAGWDVEVRRFDAAQRDENSYSQKNKNASVTLSPSADGSKGFSKIGFIAGTGTTTEKQSYEFQIESSQFNTSSLQFRLKQIDHDGQFSYSNILTVDVTPNQFGLSQNYPNPFNPTTSINYQLPIASQVRLVVFDLLGREVATLVNEKKEAGNYTANFNAANLTSGVYFYKLTAGNFSEIKKMMLVK